MTLGHHERSRLEWVRQRFLASHLWWLTLGTQEGDVFAQHCADQANAAHARLTEGDA